MGEAIRDENRVTVVLALSYLDGVTPVPVQINSSTGGLIVDRVHSIAFSPADIAPRDKNDVPVLMGVSSSDDTIPVPIYADPATGAILISTS